MNRPDRIAGLVLILLGGALFVVLQTGIGPEAVVAMAGAVFLVVYASTRAYGFLVPGCILTGLGLGVILQEQGAADEIVVLGLGGGFLAIAVVDLLVRGAQPSSLWPLIPGGILTTVGMSEYEGTASALRWWPVVLVVAGLVLLLGRRRVPPMSPPDRATPVDATQVERAEPLPPLPPPPTTVEPSSASETVEDRSRPPALPRT